MPPFVSYAQNGEDVRVWHALGPRKPQLTSPLNYVEIGANEPWLGSVTGALYQLGWRGLLVEPDPDLAGLLRTFRPGDSVVQAAAAESDGELEFYLVPGTGLGTLDAHEAQAAQERGFEVIRTTVAARRTDDLIAEWAQAQDVTDIHLLSIDVEGAEESVLAGLSLRDHRPWVICIEAVAPGTTAPTHERWQEHLLARKYREVAFDGVNRWYVAEERADQPVTTDGGATPGSTIAEAIATPFHVIDVGAFGWTTAEVRELRQDQQQGVARGAWQAELRMNEIAAEVPTREYLRQIEELRTEVVAIRGSRTYQLAQKAAKVGSKVASRLRGIRSPGPVADRIVRERHLRHVTANMKHLTDPAYLNELVVNNLAWAHDDQRPPLPPALDLAPPSDLYEIRQWLNDNIWDSDDQLDSRMDNQGDEVGRVRSALRTRVALAEMAPSTNDAGPGTDILVDGRCLQTPAFGHRGIGRFADSVVRGVRTEFGDDRVVLLVDRGLQELPTDIAGSCRQVTAVNAATGLRALVQPSPMTHDPSPLSPVLTSAVPSIAVIFDFIPLHYPTIYLKHVADRLEYAARLDALRRYSAFVGISHTAIKDAATALGIPASDKRLTSAVVAWPDDTRTSAETTPDRQVSKQGPIVLMTGDEPRKNTFGGLAGIAAATSSETKRDVRVIGMAGQETRVHHWSIAAAMRPGEAQNMPRLTDTELHDLLASASCVVVPSFDEGLSLPVIEAVNAGTPVVASDIPSHRELVGTGSFTCDPASPRSIAKAVRKARGSRRIARNQQRTLSRHSQESLPAAICAFVSSTPEGEVAFTNKDSTKGSVAATNRKLSVGVLTPWTPQPSGVADFSETVFSELARSVDVTVYSTQGAQVTDLPSRNVEEVFDDPRAVQQRHDALVTVVGNSHFHLPFVSALGVVDSIAVAHDTRMVEYYMALRGPGGAAEVMTRAADPLAPRGLTPPLDEQIQDMRLLQNTGLWEIARRSRGLVLHSPSAAARMETETGVTPHVLPFATQRVPHKDTVTLAVRQAARERLGFHEFSSGTIHLGNFGYLDVRTKLTDVVVEAAGWLTSWGHTVALHLVGAGAADVTEQIEERARQWGIHHVQVTGFQSEERFRDWLLAVDLGIQLRVSPLLGVSGPLSDLAAFGTPAVASRGLCVDVDPPAYIRPLPESVSPVLVAEAVEAALSVPMSDVDREVLRRSYLDAKSPKRYAEQLLAVIEESIG